ncbi:MAG: alanine racemase, partial [Planctomycetes bacterium]|nr:alanine racemase [Planctomycetota bacterium]
MASIAENVAAVRAEIRAACQSCGRDPSGVRLIAVTKTQGPEVLAELVAAGIADFGENRIDHLQIMHAAAPAGSVFHVIGRIQSRQIPRIVATSAYLHSLYEASHVDELARRCAQAQRRMAVFIEVNVSGEGAKGGVVPSEVPRLVEHVRSKPELDLVGLMTMAPMLAQTALNDASAPGVGESDVRRCFA